jgi:hypothetical protein
VQKCCYAPSVHMIKLTETLRLIGGAFGRGAVSRPVHAGGSGPQAIRSVIRMIPTALLTLDVCSFVLLLQVQT